MLEVKVFRKSQNQRHVPVAEGEAADIVQLLAFWGTADLYEIYDGVEYKDAREFVAGLGNPVRPADDSLTRDEKMRAEDLYDPNVHARNVQIQQIIERAIRLSHKPHYDPELLARNAAHDVIRLYY